MAHPTKADWEKHRELLDSGTKGWNVQKKLPELLPKEYPWMGEFEFGFYVEADVASRGQMGWMFLETHHFDIDEFNKVVALRYGLHDDGSGKIMSGDNYIMIMHKEYREALVNRRNREHEDLFKKQTGSQHYAVPGDPASAEYSHSEFEESVVAPRSAARRGRPPKRKG